MSRFKPDQWQVVQEMMTASRLRKHGLPSRRSKSVVIGTFNIRELGNNLDRTGNKRKGRTPGAWRLLAGICARFDLLAIQEVLDDLSGLMRLRNDIRAISGRKLRLLISDISGKRPGGSGEAERLAFLYDPRRIDHTELASEITADRGAVGEVLFAKRDAIAASTADYAAAMEVYERKRAEGGKPRKPWFAFPAFLTFIRPPHVGSFRILSKNDAQPVDLLAISAHLLYGPSNNKEERLWEFLALVEWLALRAKYADRLYAPNLLLLGDCNLFTENLREAIANEREAAGEPPEDVLGSARDFLEWKIKSINKSRLTSRKAAKANFPLLDVHPTQGVIRTNARQKETFDQIGLFTRDPRLPMHDENERVTGRGNTYDFGVFRFTDLMAEALFPHDWAQAVMAEDEARAAGASPASPFQKLQKQCRDRIVDAVDFDVSDHLPAWIRLPIPGA